MLLTGMTLIPEIYVPKEHLHLFQNFYDSYRKLSSGTNDVVKNKFIFKGLLPNQLVKINNNYFVKSFELDHDVPTLGYGLYETRTKLKAGIQVTKEEIMKNKNKYIEEINIPVFAFLCDTSIKVFEMNPEILETFNMIMIECTFIGNEDKKSKHIHWHELKPYTLKYSHIKFILIHFSIRYKTIEIDDKPDNVMIWNN